MAQVYNVNPTFPKEFLSRRMELHCYIYGMDVINVLSLPLLWKPWCKIIMILSTLYKSGNWKNMIYNLKISN